MRICKCVRAREISKYIRATVHNSISVTYVYSFDPSGEKDTDVAHWLESEVLCTMFRIPIIEEKMRESEERRGKVRRGGERKGEEGRGEEGKIN